MSIFFRKWVFSENQIYLDNCVTYLSGCRGLSNLKDQFLTHLRLVKGYLALTYFIKYEYIGVPKDDLDDLFCNFKYLTSGPFRRPITADSSKKKKLQVISHIAYERFWSINGNKGVK